MLCVADRCINTNKHTQREREKTEKRKKPCVVEKRQGERNLVSKVISLLRSLAMLYGIYGGSQPRRTWQHFQ